MPAKKQTRSAKPRGPLRLTAAVTREGRLYVAQCLEVDVASQGKSGESSLKNLREALELYFEDPTAEVHLELRNRTGRPTQTRCSSNALVAGTPVGIAKVKVLNPAGSLCAKMRPPCASTRPLEM